MCANVQFLVIFSYSHLRVRLSLMYLLRYPPMKTLQFMGNFDHTGGVINIPNNFGPSD